MQTKRAAPEERRREPGAVRPVLHVLSLTLVSSAPCFVTRSLFQQLPWGGGGVLIIRTWHTLVPKRFINECVCVCMCVVEVSCKHYKGTCRKSGIAC